MTPRDIRTLAQLHPELSKRIQRVYAGMSKLYSRPMRPTEGLRTHTRQSELYAQGRTAPGVVVTWARPGQSLHQYALAVDSCFEGADPYLEKSPMGQLLWAEFGRLCREEGLDWGGYFSKPDRPHVQLALGLTLAEIRAMYETGGMKAVWAAIDSRTPQTIA